MNYMFSKLFPKFKSLENNLETYNRDGQDTNSNKIWRMRLVCWVNMTTDTHSEYVILFAFPMQQWIRERSLKLYYV
jgi:hypothetical protein